MFLKKIEAYCFRNYKNLEIEFDNNCPINLIHSPNGMGKSNLLEIIYFLSYFRSFRSAYDSELISKGEKSFYIKGYFYKNSISNNLSVKFTTKKEIMFNDKKVDKFSKVFGELLSVLFCNEDIFIINGAPSVKRKFFDIFLSTLNIKYLYALKKYNHIVKQKNFLLKENNNLDMVSIYNMQLSKTIFFIENERKKLISEINGMFQEIFMNIGLFKEKVKILYLSSFSKHKINSEEDIYNILEKKRDKELEYGYSIMGPHRDNFLFLMNGVSFSKYASFGQTRLASLVLKLVQTEYYKKKFDLLPILLLDDVILELDRKKKEGFLRYLSNYKQIFLTVTNKSFMDYFKNKDEINTIEVEYGKIK